MMLKRLKLTGPLCFEILEFCSHLMMLMPEARAGWNKVYLLFLNKFPGFTCGFFPLSPTEDVNSLFFSAACGHSVISTVDGLKQGGGFLEAVHG